MSRLLKASCQEELLLEWEAILLEAVHNIAGLMNIDLENESSSTVNYCFPVHLCKSLGFVLCSYAKFR